MFNLPMTIPCDFFLSFRIDSPVQQAIRDLQRHQVKAENQLEKSKKYRNARHEQLVVLNGSLEAIKYANGILQAIVDQQTKFKPVAERLIKNRREGNSDTARKIDALNRRVNRALGVVTAIRLSKQMIDRRQKISTYKRKTLHRIADAIKHDLEKLRDEKKKIEGERARLTASVAESTKEVRTFNEAIFALRSTTMQTENEKMDAMSQLRDLQMQVRSQHEQMDLLKVKNEKAKAAHQHDIGSHDLIVGTLRSNVERKQNLAEAASRGLQDLKSRIIEASKTLTATTGQVALVTSDDSNKIPVFDRDALRVVIEKQEVEICHQTKEIEVVIKKISDKENDVKQREAQIVQVKENTENILTDAIQQTADEGKREQATKMFLVKCDKTRAEVSDLELSFQCLLDRRAASHQKHKEASDEFNCTVKQYQIQLEELEKKSKMADTSFKTNLRLSEEDASARLEKARADASKAQARHEQLLKDSAPESIQAEVAKLYEKDAQDIKQTWGPRLENYDKLCKPIIEQYPELKRLDYKFDGSMGLEEQTKAVLADLEKECATRKQAVHKRTMTVMRNRKMQKQKALALAGKIEKKDRQRSDMHQSWFADTDKSSKQLLPVPHGGQERRRLRRGCDFYNPMDEEIGSDSNEPTLSQPKALFPDGNCTSPGPKEESQETTIVNSQLTEKKVHWADSDKGHQNQNGGDCKTLKSTAVSRKQHSRMNKEKPSSSVREVSTSAIIKDERHLKGINEKKHKNVDKDGSRRKMHLSSIHNGRTERQKGEKIKTLTDEGVTEPHSRSSVTLKHNTHPSHSRSKDRISIHNQDDEMKFESTRHSSSDKSKELTSRSGYKLERKSKDKDVSGGKITVESSSSSNQLSVMEKNGKWSNSHQKGRSKHRKNIEKNEKLLKNVSRTSSRVSEIDDNTKKGSARSSSFNSASHKDLKSNPTKDHNRPASNSSDGITNVLSCPRSSNPRDGPTKDVTTKRSKLIEKSGGEHKGKKVRTSSSIATKESSSKIRKESQKDRGRHETKLSRGRKKCISQDDLNTSTRLHGRKKHISRDDPGASSRVRKKMKITQTSQSIVSSFTADYGGF